MRLELDQPDAPPTRFAAAWLMVGLRALRERTLWAALAAGLLALALAYQSPRSLTVDIGGEYDAGIVRGFNAAETHAGANFRWATGAGSLLFRGIGTPSAPLTVYLQLSSGRAQGTPPMAVSVAANGHALPPLRLTPASEGYTVSVDPSLIEPAGDLRLDFTAPLYHPPGERRDLGFIADFARIEWPGGLVAPAPLQLVGLLLCAALLYMLLRASWLGARAAGGVALLFLLGCAGVIAVERLLLTVFTARLLATFGLAVLTALVAEVTARGLVRASGRRGARAVPEWAWAGLRGLVAASVVVKVGGLLYPSAYVIDAYFHLKYITYMNEFLAGGRDWEQFFGKNLALSVMPKEEWGSAQAFIPYSPFFYLLAAPLSWLPLPLSLTVPAASGIFEALKVALVFVFGLALGTTSRPARLALASAAVYAVIPATFLLQQWGTWPTLTSLWLIAAWVAFTTLFWERLTRPGVWAVSTGLLTLTLLSYTVTAVYTGVFVGIAVVAGWFFAPTERRRWVALTLVGVGAAAFSLLVYYGHYIGVLVMQTLPTFGSAIKTQGTLTTLHATVGEFVVGHLATAMQSYSLALIYVLALAGVVLLLRRHRWGAAEAAWQRVWLGAWLATFPIFTLADFWVDQALKEFWYALPAVAVAAAGWLLSLGDRGWAPRLAWAAGGVLGAALTWQGLSLWVFRLLFHNR
ncbi:MAG: hypothetical protein ACR2M0_14140 [Chloroflexia bacterium]